MSADFSTTSVSATASLTSFITASASAFQSCTSPSTSTIEQYKINETIRLRERLAELNSQELRPYFKAIRKLYDELLAKNEELEVEIIVHQENLNELYDDSHQLKEQLEKIKRTVLNHCNELTKTNKRIMERIRTEAPELYEKMHILREAQKRLTHLKFSRDFINLRDKIQGQLRNGNYNQLLENYRKLLKMPCERFEYAIEENCSREFSVKSALLALAQYLQFELRSALGNVFSRIHFPFEESIDLNNFQLSLKQSAQILKCLKLVNNETLAIAGVDITRESQTEPLEYVLDEFTKRFNYHFYGDNKPTNVPDKSEWFFTQLSYWAENNLEYFEEYIQPFLDEMYNNKFKLVGKQFANDIFLQHLMRLSASKVSELVHNKQFIQDRRQLSHLIDECVMFEKEMQENYGYPEDAPVHVVSELCQADDVLEMWIKLERDILSAGVDTILADDEAYEPRYQEAADVDPYLVPNFADSFVILMQSMSERYRSIPNMRLQCRFLKLQLVIVDEFRSRIVQIGQTQEHNSFAKPFPQLLNALWYLTLVLDDWSDSSEFVRLQFYLQQFQSTSAESTFSPSQASTSISSLARGTFDESALLYRHVWRQWTRSLCESFADSIRRKLHKYANEKWYDWEGPPKPVEITPSVEPFLREVGELLTWITESISPESVLTFFHLTNHEVWSTLDQCVISQTAFSYKGAAQILYDATNALIPLLNHCYGKMNGVSEFDIFNEKCVNVLATLRLLALPPPTAILLKDEVKHIPEQQLDQKLEQEFNIMGLTKARVIELLEQRCDLVLFEKLIG